MKNYRVRLKFHQPGLPLSLDFFCKAENSFEALQIAAANAITNTHPFASIRDKVVIMEAFEDFTRR